MIRLSLLVAAFLPIAAAAQSVAPPATDALKPGEGAWANYDFKPGSRILYADDFTRDEVGNFPKRMEFVSGSMEIVEWQRGRWLRGTTSSRFYIVLPEVLPERYTLEFDVAVSNNLLYLSPAGKVDGDLIMFGNGGEGSVGGSHTLTRSATQPALMGKVFRARVMADGPYVKLYVNDLRVANVPNFSPLRAKRILLFNDARIEHPMLIGNIRVAASGKKLYDALTDSGRVATQGIYFDTGSDRIRPESTPTLKEIGAMLAEHAELKLAIEGNTDNVGDAASNQALSEKRAAAVRQFLVTNFQVDAVRLTSQGLGATKPAASNDTPEGRQMNRRVELVRR
jgi:outer membrane protein OmpA-like peptidoglycan-associated protein